jgi:hypothetical protein
MDLHRINSCNNERGQEISPHVFESGKPLVYFPTPDTIDFD